MIPRADADVRVYPRAMRPLLHSLVAASFVAACSSAPTEPVGSSSGTSTAGTEAPQDAAREPAGGEPMDTSTVRAPRATLDPQRLEICSPDAALLAGAPEVEVRLQPTLGGCALRRPAAQAEGEPAMLALDVIGGPTRVGEFVTCEAGQTPSVDFTTTSYATFTSTHRVSEDWNVVFAVDDGERVHVGVRLGRNCEPASATTAPDVRAFEIAGRARSIVVHRCEPRSEPRAPAPVCP